MKWKYSDQKLPGEEARSEMEQEDTEEDIVEAVVEEVTGAGEDTIAEDVEDHILQDAEDRDLEVRYIKYYFVFYNINYSLSIGTY